MKNRILAYLKDLRKRANEEDRIVIDNLIYLLVRK
jgi:hypothetical protein